MSPLGPVRELLRSARRGLAAVTAPRTVAPLVEGVPEAVRLGSPGAHVFFGYHDKCPFDAGGGRVLAHRVRCEGAGSEPPAVEAEVGFFPLGPGPVPFTRVGNTHAWSWQQGSMLQWDPLAPGRRVVFNRSGPSGGSRGVVVDADTLGVVEEWGAPVYALSPRGDRWLYLDFGRLARLRPGYGHAADRASEDDDPAPAGDGVWIVDRGGSPGRLLVSLADLARDSGAPAGAHHYVNHLSWSPDASRLVFFHVWQRPGERRRIRFMAGEPGSETCRPFEAERLVSHFCWLDDTRLLATTRDAGLRWRYTIYDLAGGGRADLASGPGVDGHPMRAPHAEDVVVTDTTPDPRGRQHLLLMNLTGGAMVEVGGWRTPRAFHGPVRCDLHPRWDRDGRRLCVDSASSGRREILVVGLPEGWRP